MPNVLAIQAAPTDSFQQCVKHVVDGETDWPAASGGDRAEVEAQRRRLARELFDGAEVVDLVGHSTPRSCCLRLGDWVLDPAEAARLASYMPKSVKIVRLIGCSTATTEEGRAAAAAFARGGLQAFGTLNRVYTTHFDRNGVKRGIEAPPLLGFFPDGRGSFHTSGPTADGGRARGPLAWVRRGAWWVIAVLHGLFLRVLRAHGTPRSRISGLLRSEGVAMPGLLTDPLLTFAIASGAETWTLEILFDFEYARFYSSASSAAERDLVYEIRGSGWIARTPLEAYLERAPRGVTLIQRHDEAGDHWARVSRVDRERGDSGS
jgi:hypothetical protein